MAARALIIAKDAVISIEGLKNITKSDSEPLSLAVFGMSLGVGPLDARGRAVADFAQSCLKQLRCPLREVSPISSHGLSDERVCSRQGAMKRK